VDFVRAVAAQADLTITHAGSPVRGQSSGVAQALGGQTIDDLRHALSATDVDLVWIVSPSDFGRAAEDARAVAAARARGTRIAVGEPIPSSILELAPAGWTGASAGASPIDAIRFLGLPRRSRPFREAAEVLASFGTPRSAVIECWCGPQHGTLASRVFAALDTLRFLMGDPESIAASYTTPGLETPEAMASIASHAEPRVPRPSPTSRSLPPESLRDLQGDLIATARYDRGATASIVASNHAGRWNTTATLLSPQGRLRLYDDGFEWLAPDGTKRDELRLRHATRGDPTITLHGVTALAEDLARMTDPSLAQDAPIDITALLALTQAALLSARTGHPESPATIRGMVG
jgi:predicted dehydrogenase